VGRQYLDTLELVLLPLRPVDAARYRPQRDEHKHRCPPLSFSPWAGNIFLEPPWHPPPGALRLGLRGSPPATPPFEPTTKTAFLLSLLHVIYAGSVIPLERKGERPMFDREFVKIRLESLIVLARLLWFCLRC
jgi:hypothetical protein